MSAISLIRLWVSRDTTHAAATILVKTDDAYQSLQTAVQQVQDQGWNIHRIEDVRPLDDRPARSDGEDVSELYDQAQAKGAACLITPVSCAPPAFP